MQLVPPGTGAGGGQARVLATYGEEADVAASQLAVGRLPYLVLAALRACCRYLEPLVEESMEPFEWGLPDLDALRRCSAYSSPAGSSLGPVEFVLAAADINRVRCCRLCQRSFGWTSDKADEHLLPVGVALCGFSTALCRFLCHNQTLKAPWDASLTPAHRSRAPHLHARAVRGWACRL